MKTIKQTVEVQFKAIEIKEVIIMVDFMNSLQKAITCNKAAEIYNNMPKEEQAKYRRIWKERADVDHNLENIYELLLNLGFVSTNNVDVQDILNNHKINDKEK